jgi:hypothetical protein
MTVFAKLAEEIFRDYQTGGYSATPAVPASGPWSPRKTDIRAWAASVEAAVGILAVVGNDLTLPGNLTLNGVTPGIEFGSGATPNNPFIDWHSSGLGTDYDVRLQASGGTASVGAGYLTLTGSFVLAPRASSLLTAIQSSQSAAGAAPGTDNYLLNDITIASDVIDNGAYFVEGMRVRHSFGGSAAKGGREAFHVDAFLTAATSASNTNRNYCAIAAVAHAYASDGGTLGSEKGAIFGIGATGGAESGATNLLEVTAAEFNTAMRTGSSALYKTIISLVGRSDDAVRGYTYDCMLAMSNQAGGVTFDNGILIGPMNGIAPVRTTGKIMATTGSATVDMGIDFSSYTITTAAFKSPNYVVSGAGLVTCSAISTGAGISTGDAAIEVGGGRTGSGTAYVDLHATSGSDYELRLVRGSGTNGAADLLQTGTGGLNINVVGAGALVLLTNNTAALTVSSAQVVSLANALLPASGGTGIASYAVGDLLYASGAATLAKLADVATGSVLVSGGVNTAPAWSAAITVTTSVTTAALAGTTSTTSPLIIGGSGTTQTLIHKTTTGVGAAGADHIFQVGNNGATEAMRILNSGFVGIGVTNPGSILEARSMTSGDQLRIGTTDNATFYYKMGRDGSNGDLTFQGGQSGFSNYSFKNSAGTTIIRFLDAGNVKIGGTADRGTTEGTNQLAIFNGTAPVGTLTNGASFYAASGEMRVMDSAGNSTLLSPHDRETNEWIYHSVIGRKGLRIDMERAMRFLNDNFAGDFVHDFIVEAA